MPQYSYAIGSSNPPTNVEELPTPVNPPRGRFSEHSVLLDRSNGRVSGHGFPSAIWHFDILTQDMIDQLRLFCPGASATVYLTTRKNDGTFDTYRAIMIWPTQTQLDARAAGGRYLGLEFTFRRLEAV